jgi:hypothetical protein
MYCLLLRTCFRSIDWTNGELSTENVDVNWEKNNSCAFVDFFLGRANFALLNHQDSRYGGEMSMMFQRLSSIVLLHLYRWLSHCFFFWPKADFGFAIWVKLSVLVGIGSMPGTNQWPMRPQMQTRGLKLKSIPLCNKNKKQTRVWLKDKLCSLIIIRSLAGMKQSTRGSCSV